MLVHRPRQGRLTQGTVFCGACAEDYAGHPVWGVVVTARCDTANGKAPLINYLPIVTVSDWVRYQGALIVAERVRADQFGRFREELKRIGLSSTPLDVHSPRIVAEVHFPNAEEQKGDRSCERRRKTVEEIVSSIELCELVLAGRGNPEPLLEVCNRNRKSLTVILVELITHRLSGFYYLPSLGDDTENACAAGYVALLREVYHLPSEVAAQLCDGITVDGTPGRGLRFDVFDLAWPVAEIASPWIEHLMQAFCGLFGRIGVEDVPKDRVTHILGEVFPSQEGTPL